MEYELAKELKDAGFPQRNTRICNLIEDEVHVVETEFYFPTLSELIEACVGMTEDGDFHLEHLYDEWGAATCHSHKERDDWERGKTPEEAEARLWLNLKKRNGNITSGSPHPHGYSGGAVGSGEQLEGK